MKIIAILAALCLLTTISFSQKIHDPAQILQIMEKSSVSYELDVLSSPILCPDRSDNLNYNSVYRIKTDSSIMTYSYALKPEAKPFLDKAEYHFSNRNIDSARIYYEKVLEIDPTYYKAMTYIGQMYGTKRDMDKSLEWYNKAIHANYIDYLAHWFIADIYRMKGDLKDAVDEITIAMILNRNNPRLKETRNEIYKLAKRKQDDWCFVPQYKIVSNDNSVKISFNEIWLGYAMAKALWQYEPGYKQSMGVQENVYSSLEDKECLLVLIAGLINSKTNIKKYPELTTLKKAIERDFLNEYIFYEIVLPEHPNVAYQLSEDFISRIKEYVLTVRN